MATNISSKSSQNISHGIIPQLGGGKVECRIGMDYNSLNTLFWICQLG